MKQQNALLVILGLFLGIMVIPNITISHAVVTATMDDPIDTDFKFNTEIGDWIGLNLSTFDVDETGIVDKEWNYVVVTPREIIKTAISARITFDAYQNITDDPTFPKQDAFLNLDQWETTGQETFEFAKTRGSFVNPFVLPDDLVVSDIFVEVENMSQYYDYFPFDEVPSSSELADDIGRNETLYEDYEYSITSDEISCQFEHTADMNFSVDGNPTYRYVLSYRHSVNMSFNPQHNFMAEFNMYFRFILRVYDDDTYGNMVSEQYNGGGGDYKVIYDSNPNRGVWFYENWQWFIPTLLVAGIGLGVIVWWQVSLKQCEKDIANAFCRDPAEYRKRKYKGQTPPPAVSSIKSEPVAEPSLLSKLQ